MSFHAFEHLPPRVANRWEQNLVPDIRTYSPHDEEPEQERANRHPDPSDRPDPPRVRKQQPRRQPEQQHDPVHGQRHQGRSVRAREIASKQDERHTLRSEDVRDHDGEDHGKSADPPGQAPRLPGTQKPNHYAPGDDKADERHSEDARVGAEDQPRPFHRIGAPRIRPSQHVMGDVQGS